MPQRDNLRSIRVAELFAVANQTQDATEPERVEAVNELLSEFRLQWEQYGREEIAQIDPLLVQGIKLWGCQIFAKINPVLALEKLLGARQKRGKRAKNTDRDFQIAVAVLDKMKSKLSLEEASEAVASDYNLDGDSIRKIYNRNHREAKAHVQMCALEKK